MVFPQSDTLIVFNLCSKYIIDFQDAFVLLLSVNLQVPLSVSLSCYIARFFVCLFLLYAHCD